MIAVEHTLVADGWPPPWQMIHGRAVCSCGWQSSVEGSDDVRRAAHAQHIEEQVPTLTR